ncbi:MAG: relaxase domain-containing protein [Heteroscytonema crispum UTEX LB 1556]
MSAGRAEYYTEVIAIDDGRKDGGESPGYFIGEGAEALGILGREIVRKDEALRDLFHGRDPTTKERLRHVSLTERTYVELTH